MSDVPSAVHWREWDGDRAFEAASGDYRLTTNLAETRGNVWFWCVKRGGRQIPGGSGDATGPEAAKRDAEGAMAAHRSENEIAPA